MRPETGGRRSFAFRRFGYGRSTFWGTNQSSRSNGDVASIGAVARRLSDYEGTYENRKLGRMVWRVVGEGLEVRMGVARSRTITFSLPTPPEP